jgi:hypothetical protein
VQGVERQSGAADRRELFVGEQDVADRDPVQLRGGGRAVDVEGVVGVAVVEEQRHDREAQGDRGRGGVGEPPGLRGIVVVRFCAVASERDGHSDGYGGRRPYGRPRDPVAQGDEHGEQDAAGDAERREARPARPRPVRVWGARGELALV